MNDLLDSDLVFIEAVLTVSGSAFSAFGDEKMSSGDFGLSVSRT